MLKPEEDLLPENAMSENTRAMFYVPGVFRCAKCNFRVVQSNLNAADGTVTARDAPGEKCPNDGAPLWRVTYRDEFADAHEQWEAQVKRAVAAETRVADLEAALKRTDEHMRTFADYHPTERTSETEAIIWCNEQLLRGNSPGASVDVERPEDTRR